MRNNKLKLSLLLITVILVIVVSLLYFYRDDFLKIVAYFRPENVVKTEESAEVKAEDTPEVKVDSKLNKASHESLAPPPAESKAIVLEETIKKNCLIMGQLLVAGQIKEAFYQDKSYDKLIDKILNDSNKQEVRKAINGLVGIGAISHPGFKSLIEDFKPVTKALLIEAKLNEENEFYKKVLYRLLYKVIFLRKLSGNITELEVNLLGISKALEDRDLQSASSILDKIKTENVKFTYWKEHFKMLLNELDMIDKIIVSLSGSENCADAK